MTTVKFIHNAMTGAPVITNVAGTLIAALDACLVNGFGVGTLDSLVVANNLATATRSVGHPMEIGTICEISGATPAGLNGQKRVLATTTTTYSFDATGISDQSATGAITGKVASLGWDKAFSGTNIAVYRAQTGTRCYLRVDDTNGVSARVIGYESMTDVNTGTNAFPTSTQVTGGPHWDKNSATTPRNWTIVGDSRAFYFFTAPGGTSTHRTMFFGDFVSRKSGDIYNCALTGSSSSFSTSGEGTVTASVGYSYRTSNSSIWAARAVSGVGTSSVLFKQSASIASQNNGTAVSTGGYTYPNPGDNALLLIPIMVADQTPYSDRGILPGLFAADQNITGVFQNREYVTGVAPLDGRVLRVAADTGNSTLFFDTTGPWR